VGAIPIRVSNTDGYRKYGKWFLAGATDDTEQIPYSEAKRFSSSQQFPCVLCTKGHHFLSSTKQSISSTSILIFSSTPRSFKWSPYSYFLIKSLYRFLSSQCATCPALTTHACLVKSTNREAPLCIVVSVLLLFLPF